MKTFLSGRKFFFLLLIATAIVIPLRRGENPLGYLLLFGPLVVVQLWWERVRGHDLPLRVWVPLFVVWFAVAIVIHRLLHPAL